LFDPLVSVIVTTYCSGRFVIETLESVKMQTWQNIELIVSDDCSTDDTVEKCRQWVHDNKDRFVRTDIITVPQNTGVSANCNRSISASNADWIKFIAGDDILLPECIEDNIQFALQATDRKIVFSQVLLYKDVFTESSFIKKVPQDFPVNLLDPAFDAAHQFKLLLLSDRINYTPSYFFNKSALLSVGGYDEENKLMEDYPMWLKLTKAGFRLSYFHKATVGYRQHGAALNNVAHYGLFKPLLLKMAGMKETYVYPYLPWDIAGSDRYIAKVSALFQKLGFNRQTTILSGLYKLTTVYLNPFRYVIFFKKKILKVNTRNVFYAD
jgi:glycosyltransferase involved in cell wall biosynthesis